MPQHDQFILLVSHDVLKVAVDSSDGPLRGPLLNRRLILQVLEAMLVSGRTMAWVATPVVIETSINICVLLVTISIRLITDVPHHPKVCLNV